MDVGIYRTRGMNRQPGPHLLPASPDLISSQICEAAPACTYCPTPGHKCCFCTEHLLAPSHGLCLAAVLETRAHTWVGTADSAITTPHFEAAWREAGPSVPPCWGDTISWGSWEETPNGAPTHFLSQRYPNLSHLPMTCRTYTHWPQ